MSQKMLEGDFEWLSQNECRDMELHVNYSDGRIALFDTWLFDNQENEEDKKRLILDVDFEYPPELYERDDDYPLASKVMTIELEIICVKQHNLRVLYFGAAGP